MNCEFGLLRGDNPVNAAIYDAASTLVLQQSTTVYRSPPVTTFIVSHVLDTAPNGEVYFENGVDSQDVWRVPPAAGAAGQPAWQLESKIRRT